MPTMFVGIQAIFLFHIDFRGVGMYRKAAGLYIVIVVLFAGMVCRIYALTMGDTLASVANTQSAFLLEVDRTRGVIYDRNMQPLVGTKIKPVAAVAPVPETVKALAELSQEKGLSYDRQARQPYLLYPEEDIYAHGIQMFDVAQRYSDGQLAPHIIGYLAPDHEEGAAGIELACNDILEAHSGSLKLRYTMDAAGRTLDIEPEIITDNYQDAGGVVLTLDAGIQRAAQNAMAKVEKGAAIVMDVNTGNLLASVSLPAYDANHLAESLQDKNSPFVNRAFSPYSVGSTFKLVVAAAALENGFGRYTPYTCKGYIDVSNHIFYCHWRPGHGELDLKRALEISCNPYFINLGRIATGSRITAMARSIGFSRASYLSEDLVTQSGTLPSQQELENPAALANLSFGQGSLTATPVQIAQMICAVANGGYAVTPRLIEGETEDGEAVQNHMPVYASNRVFSEKTSDILKECLVANVEEGSGEKARPLRGQAGGKTASAQTGIYRTPGKEDSEIVHAWFAGFYPADTPRYAIVVLVEGGNSGSDSAAPIFKKIADAIGILDLTQP